MQIPQRGEDGAHLVMKRDLAGQLRKAALKKPQTLKWVDPAHRALERQVGVKTFEQLDRLLDQQLHLGVVELIDS